MLAYIITNYNCIFPDRAPFLFRRSIYYSQFAGCATTAANSRQACILEGMVGAPALFCILPCRAPFQFHRSICYSQSLVSLHPSPNSRLERIPMYKWAGSEAAVGVQCLCRARWIKRPPFSGTCTHNRFPWFGVSQCLGPDSKLVRISAGTLPVQLVWLNENWQ